MNAILAEVLGDTVAVLVTGAVLGFIWWRFILPLVTRPAANGVVEEEDLR